MKRSEILLKLQATLFWNRRVMDDKELANILLKAVEDAGMAPPETGGSMGCSDPECCPQGGHYWDEEDK